MCVIDGQTRGLFFRVCTKVVFRFADCSYPVGGVRFFEKEKSIKKRIGGSLFFAEGSAVQKGRVAYPWLKGTGQLISSVSLTSPGGRIHRGDWCALRVEDEEGKRSKREGGRGLSFGVAAL